MRAPWEWREPWKSASAFLFGVAIAMTAYFALGWLIGGR